MDCDSSKSLLEDDSKSIKASVILPRTAFSLWRKKAPAVSDEMRELCTRQTYLWQHHRERPAKGTFVLHDGPPYANGDLHMGHALNKILKDIINRQKAAQGYSVSFVPGWDCHGLPIEHKALKAISGTQAKHLSPLHIRSLARETAQSTISSQAEEFKDWGIMADWDKPYVTMDPEYEAEQLGVWWHMYREGHVYHGLKPVMWSPTSRTALADAEVEYPEEGHTSTAVWAAFPVDKPSDELKRVLLEECPEHSSVEMAVWTTTPWTLPANKAVCVHPDVEYQLLSISDRPDRLLVVAASRVEALQAALGDSSRVMAVAPRLSGRDLLGTSYRLPLPTTTPSMAETPATSDDGDANHRPPRAMYSIIGGAHVTDDSGTGLVHTAPGHGMEDFDVCRKYGIAAFCPVDEDGVFTPEAGDHFNGKHVLGDGNDAVVSALRHNGALLREEKYHHRYPYDWRTKSPLIIRATKQWFVSLDGLLGRALDALGSAEDEGGAQDNHSRGVVRIHPEAARRRFKAILHARRGGTSNAAEQLECNAPSGDASSSSSVGGGSDWCISRQRVWGVPIPVFYERGSGEPVVCKELVEHVQQLVRTHPRGADCWWELPHHELLPPGLRHRSEELVRGSDTMDVWFDSGSSWQGVLRQRGLAHPADLYLEGSDQPRGWFQSSLLTSLACTGAAPYRALTMHGFVLDEEGRKMSKSLGNVVSPSSVLHGTAATSAPKSDNHTNNKSDRNAKKRNKSKGQPRTTATTTTMPAYGVDVLRMWVAATDFTKDVQIGPSVLERTAGATRRVRNTLRFLLGNLDDFDPDAHAVGVRHMGALDRMMLGRLAALGERVSRAYDAQQFSQVSKSLLRFCSGDLSSTYFEATKDRLYSDARNSTSRRAAQTVYRHCLDVLVRSIAPIACHMAEEVRMHDAHLRASAPDNVLQLGWIDPSALAQWESHGSTTPSSEESEEEGAQRWDTLHQMKSRIEQALQPFKAGKAIASAQDTAVVLHVSKGSPAHKLLSSVGESGLADFLVVSQARLAVAEDEMQATTSSTDHHRGGGGPFEMLEGNAEAILLREYDLMPRGGEDDHGGGGGGGHERDNDGDGHDDDPWRSSSSEYSPLEGLRVSIYNLSAAAENGTTTATQMCCKCPRCWKYHFEAAPREGTQPRRLSEDMCARCSNVYRSALAEE